MPTITSSNTSIPTIMIGERFAAWIREGRIGEALQRLCQAAPADEGPA